VLFNSIEFAIFLPVVFGLYWFAFNRSLRAQNLLIVTASFLFYGWWDWRFLFLLVFSAGIDFYTAQFIYRASDKRRKKLLLLVSLGVNLGILGFFKYFNFFVDNFISAFRLFGQEFHPFTLQIILPVGVSFYTFQALSYTIDVYRGKLVPTQDGVAYFAFISFFPQLVAGPIERATNLLPQFYQSRTFDYTKAVDGLRQILWGLFKKIVIADNCAQYADKIFNNYTDYDGSTLLLGAFFFAFQIYGDFSGYSDIAIGTSRLFGFDLMRNFAFPYFSRDIAEFWRRWHISLSTWFRDYVYIPLGGSQGSKWIKIRNTFIIFLLSGFWHGANWTFVVWGALNAIYFMPLLMRGKNRTHLDVVDEGKLLPSLKGLWKMSSTFLLVLLAWIFFRAENLHDALKYVAKIFQASLLSVPKVHPIPLLAGIFVFVGIEWLQRDKPHALHFAHLTRGKRAWVWTFSYLLIAFIFLFGKNSQSFIYFQF
jgi:alginate O-acetyltransferase complex protein AlgI